MRKLAAAALAAAFLAGAAQADDDSDEALRAKYDAAMAVLGDHAFHEKWSAKESIRTGEEADRVLSLADDELKRIHEAVKNVRPWCQKKFLVNACIDEARKLSFEREREVRSIMNAANDVKRAERTAAYEKKRAEALDEIRGPKTDIGFGNQIRSYVLYPYQMVKDLRTGVETGDVDAVLEDGDLDRFVVGYHRWATGNE